MRTNFNINVLHNLNFMYDLKFDPIKSFLNHNSEQIEEGYKSISSKIEKWDSIKSDDILFPTGFDRYEDDLYRFGEFRQILNTSILLSVYGIFENELKRLCQIAGKLNGSNLSPNDLNNKNYIGKCKMYLEKILNIDMSSLEKYWEEILIVQNIRNAIAHNNRIIKNNIPNTKRFIENKDGLNISNYNEIQIENEKYMESFINLVYTYLNELIGIIIKKYQQED